MKKVKITGTTYGYRTPDGKLEPKDRSSEPFMLDDTEANRLVSLGVAVVVEEGKGMYKTDNKPEKGNTLPVNEKTGEEVEEYSKNMSMTELKEIAKTVGIPFKFGMSKKDLIKALEEHEAASISSINAEDAIV